ncbi:MAG: hypothetical protein Q8S84_01220 [bacterium]|nr:hypothetical protein [bacterium]
MNSFLYFNHRFIGISIHHNTIFVVDGNESIISIILDFKFVVDSHLSQSFHHITSITISGFKSKYNHTLDFNQSEVSHDIQALTIL